MNSNEANIALARTHVSDFDGLSDREQEIVLRAIRDLKRANWIWDPDVIHRRIDESYADGLASRLHSDTVPYYEQRISDWDCEEEEGITYGQEA